MKVISVSRLIDSYMPYVRYVVFDSEAERVRGLCSAGGIDFTCSWFNSYERRWSGRDFKKMLVVRHSALGDSLMVTGLVRAIRARFDGEIYVPVNKENSSVWAYNTDASCLLFPTPFELAIKCDAHVCMEMMLEGDSEPDQANAYNNMFDWCGLKVSEREMIPHLVWGDVDSQNEKEWFKLLSEKKMLSYWVYHWSPNNSVRQVPPSVSCEIIRKVNDALGVPCVVVGRGEDMPAMDGVLNLINKVTSFRGLIPVLKHSRLLMCPDSSVGHLAGSDLLSHIPVVSLWGAFGAKDRVSSYKNHTPYTEMGVCPHAPCHTHLMNKLPVRKCADAKGYTSEEVYCRVLASLNVDKIVELAKEKAIK